MLQEIASELKKHFDKKIVDELLAAHQEAKHHYYIGGLRLSEVEGGRFCEAAFRMLQEVTTKKFTALGKHLDTEAIIKDVLGADPAKTPDSIRIHIPRALRVIYDIRNKRDAAHLSGEVDPNLQDATLVVSCIDWVLAEFLRLYHGVSANEAQKLVDGLIIRRVPAVEDFDGFLKVLRPKGKAREYVLLLLYERATQGATGEELRSWVKPKMLSNLRRTLNGLVHEDAFIHEGQGRFRITALGRAEVERKNLHRVE